MKIDVFKKYWTHYIGRICILKKNTMSGINTDDFNKNWCFLELLEWLYTKDFHTSSPGRSPVFELFSLLDSWGSLSRFEVVSFKIGSDLARFRNSWSSTRFGLGVNIPAFGLDSVSLQVFSELIGWLTSSPDFFFSFFFLSFDFFLDLILIFAFLALDFLTFFFLPSFLSSSSDSDEVPLKRVIIIFFLTFTLLVYNIIPKTS